MKKVSAFTIIEIIVAMLISGIVISASYTIYFNFKVLFIETQLEFEENSRILLLQSLLKRDFREADFIKSRNDELIINFADKEKIYYEIEEDFIVRNNQEIVDTFFIIIDDYYIGKLKNNLLYVDEIILYIELEELEFPIHITKKYTNDYIFNH